MSIFAFFIYLCYLYLSFLYISINALFIYQCSLYLSMLSLSIYSLYIFPSSLYLSILSLSIYPLFEYQFSLSMQFQWHIPSFAYFYIRLSLPLSLLQISSLSFSLFPHIKCVKSKPLKGKASPITLFVTDGRFDEANNTNCNLQFQTKNTKNLSNLGCRTSSVDSSVPSILSPLVLVSSTPSTLLSIYI